MLSVIGEETGVPRAWLLEAVRATLGEAREAVQEGSPAPPVHEVAERAKAAASYLMAPSLRSVINASGVVIQTNLGRAPLSERASAASSSSGAAAVKPTTRKFDECTRRMAAVWSPIAAA